MINTRTIRRIGAGTGILFIAIQMTTLLAPPITVALIANDKKLSLVGQFRAALDAYCEHIAKQFDYAPDSVAFGWWLALASALVLLAAGVFAAIRTGTAYSVFVGVFLTATVAHWVLWLVELPSFFWVTEALVTLLIMVALWLLAGRRGHIA